MPVVEENENTHPPAVSDIATDERTNDDLDKIADSAEKPTNRERPMKDAPASDPRAKEEVFEFPHNGKTIKGTREQLLKWAQQGYDYPQRAQKLNQEKAQWENSRKQWEQQWGLYKQIDDYAKTNKDWWNLVQTSWQNRNNPQQPMAQPQAAGQMPPGQDPYAYKFQALEQKLSQFEQLASTIAEEKKIAAQKEQDNKLATEIQSIQEQYKDLDWKSLDENGKTLELKILEHAQNNGIPTFRAAMRDLLHDVLLNRAQSTGKLAVSKGIQNRTKLGVLGESPTPTKGMPSRTKEIRKSSYEDLEQEIREELRLSNRS